MSPQFDKLLNDLELWGAEPEQVLHETFQGDSDFYLECLHKLSSDENLQLLRESLTPEKKDDAIRAVHTIKGNADYLGLFPVMDAAIIILTELRAGRLEQAAGHLPALEEAFAGFAAVLNTYSA